VGFAFSNAPRSSETGPGHHHGRASIRDDATASIAVQAAFDGDWCCPLCTRRRAGAVTRFGTGVVPISRAARCAVSIAKRLRPGICSNCKTEYDPRRDPQIVRVTGRRSVTKFYRGVGLQECRNTGFAGGSQFTSCSARRRGLGRTANGLMQRKKLRDKAW
jgi:type II secretory ATPase GspE/PulE/Tfp pilus assembly ATPase PilB-like protein